MHIPNHYQLPPWAAKWLEDQTNPYPRDGRYNYYDSYAGQQVGPLEVPFNAATAYRAQQNGMGAETPSRTVGRQVGAAEYPSQQMLQFPSWMEGPFAQMRGKNYAKLLMSYINQGQTDGPRNPFSELKSNPLMAQLLAAKAGRGPNPYLPSSQNYIPDSGMSVGIGMPSASVAPPTDERRFGNLRPSVSPQVPMLPPKPHSPNPAPSPAPGGSRSPRIPIQPQPPKFQEERPMQPSQKEKALPSLDNFIPRYERPKVKGR